MLGVIGGMGPAASSLFYDMITEETGAERDQDNLDLILISRSSMPDRTAAILSGDRNKIEKVRGQLLADARLLEGAGCRALAVTCNTAHYFVDMIEEEISIPFIHMIRETACRVAEEKPGKKIAILATDGTIRTELYQRECHKRGLDTLVPEAPVQKLVMTEIYDRIKAGKKADRPMWAAIEKAIREQGADGAILACTELSVVKQELALDSFYFDPLRILARASLAYCRRYGDVR